MKHTNYTPEFKARVVLEVISGERSLNEIATGYELNPNLLRTWKKEFTENASKVFAGSAEAKEERRKEERLEKQQQRMLKTIGQLTLERDFLQDCFRKSGIPVPDIGNKKQ